MPLIIDGNNLLQSIKKSGEDFESLTASRLCRIISTYLRLTGEKGEIVFDGTGPPDKSEFDNISHLEVFFAGVAADADTVIEGQIRINTAPKRLTVVSSDRRLRSAARARRATAVKADVFWNDVQRQLSRKKTPKEPAEKRLGLTAGETQKWLEFFGLER
ncbi:MAG: NYN domain-containing protein [Planctomycetota bacterium]|nr:MAG: NYN domain-containing protein [Planctomycetota bacterium]